MDKPKNFIHFQCSKVVFVFSLVFRWLKDHHGWTWRDLLFVCKCDLTVPYWAYVESVRKMPELERRAFARLRKEIDG
jgi:hypothetical protein